MFNTLFQGLNGFSQALQIKMRKTKNKKTPAVTPPERLDFQEKFVLFCEKSEALVMVTDIAN